MEKYWIPLQSIPAAGKTLIFDDQDIWLDPVREFGLDCRIMEPLKAEIFMLPQEQGVLFRGRVHGAVALPCDRCADECAVTLDHAFDSFEPYPLDAPLPKDKGRKFAGPKGLATEAPAEDDIADPVDETVIRLAPHGRGIEVNPASLAWEEFSLALPVKPVCSEGCKGLCPVCGGNMNADPCSCKAPEGDPRLAVLRGLTVKGK